MKHRHMRHFGKDDDRGGDRESRGRWGHHEERGRRGHRRFEGERGRARHGRFFGHGDFRYVALQLIAEKPRHGYDIIKAIEEKSGGAYSPSAGAVYPTLTMLEELGQVSVAPDEAGRKLYTITDEGHAALLANRKSGKTLLERWEDDDSRPAQSRQVREAFKRLRSLIRERLADDDLTDEQASAIADTLNNLSDSIERS